MNGKPPQTCLLIRLDTKTKEALTEYSAMRHVSVTKMIQSIIERELDTHKDELARYHEERATQIRGGNAE